MPPLRRLGTTAAACTLATTAVLLTGCTATDTSNDPPSAGTRPSAAPSHPSPPPRPAFHFPKDFKVSFEGWNPVLGGPNARAAARAAQDYVRALNQARINHTYSGSYAKVSAGKALTYIKKEIGRYKDGPYGPDTVTGVDRYFGNDYSGLLLNSNEAIMGYCEDMGGLRKHAIDAAHSQDRKTSSHRYAFYNASLVKGEDGLWRTESRISFKGADEDCPKRLRASHG